MNTEYDYIISELSATFMNGNKVMNKIIQENDDDDKWVQLKLWYKHIVNEGFYYKLFFTIILPN